MAIEISERLVRRTFQSLEKLSNLPVEWNESQLVASQSLRAKLLDNLYLVDAIFKEAITYHVSEWRKIEKLPDDYALQFNHSLSKDWYRDDNDLHRALRADLQASRRDSDLKAWSALYHSYYVAHALSKAELSEVADYSDRQLRNHRKRGIALLARYLQEEENRAAEIASTITSLHPSNLIERHAQNLVNEAQSLLALGDYQGALHKCDECSAYSTEHGLSLMFVLAQTTKAYTLLHHQSQQPMETKAALDAAENSPLLKQFPSAAHEAHAMIVLHTQHAYLHKRMGHIHDAVKSAAEAVRWTPHLRSAKPLVCSEAYHVQGIMLWAAGQYQQALDAYHQARLIYKKQELCEREGYELGAIGLTYWSMSRYADALTHLRLAVDYARQYKNTWRMAYEMGNVGLVYLSMGKLTESLNYIRLQLEHSRQVNAVGEMARARANMGTVMIHTGEWDQARQLLEASLSELEKQHKPESLCVLYCTLSQLETLTNHHQQALDWAQMSYDRALKLDTRPARILALRGLGGCELLDIDVRYRYLQEAFELACDFRPFDAVAAVLVQAHLTNNAQLRIRFWDNSVKLLREMGASAWLEGKSAGDNFHLPLMM